MMVAASFISSANQTFRILKLSSITKSKADCPFFANWRILSAKSVACCPISRTKGQRVGEKFRVHEIYSI